MAVPQPSVFSVFSVADAETARRVLRCSSLALLLVDGVDSSASRLADDSLAIIVSREILRDLSLDTDDGDGGVADVEPFTS